MDAGRGATVGSGWARRAATAVALGLLVALLAGWGGVARVRAQEGDAAAGAGERSITTVGYGRAAVSAETAEVQLVFATQEAYAGPFPRISRDETLGESERLAAEPVVAALVAAGLPEDGVTIITSPALTAFGGQGGRGVFRIDLTVEDAELSLERMNELVGAAGQAAAAEGLILSFVGARYDVADCAAVRRDARQAANEDARARAEEQAELMGVELGDELRASDVPAAASGGSYDPYSGVLPSARNGCDPSLDTSVSFGLGTSISVPAFNPTAGTEVDVYTQVVMTYAVAEA